MSYFAFYKTADTGEYILVYAKNCTDNDRELDFFCPSCGAILRLRGGEQIKLHFYGKHEAACNISHFQSETLVMKNGFTANLDAICARIDLPFEPKAPGPEPGESGQEPGQEPGQKLGQKLKPAVIEKQNIVYTAKVLSTAKALKNNIYYLPLNFPLSLDGLTKVGHVIIRHDNLALCRKNGIDGEIRLVIVQRIPLEKVPPSIRKAGYIVFRDALSSSDEDAFYFLVRMTDPSQHEHLLNLVAGPQDVRDKHKYIVLLGRWKKLPDCSYNAYYSDINSSCYYFTDVK